MRYNTKSRLRNRNRMRKPAKKTYVKKNKNKNKKSRVRRRTVKGGAADGIISGFTNLFSDQDLTLIINKDYIELKPSLIKEGANYTKIKISDGVENIHSEFFQEKNGDKFTVLENFKNVNEIIFPNSLKFIANESFKKFQKLKTLQFSQGSSDPLLIGGGAFSDCTALEKVTLPSNINIIRESAFYNCTSLNVINIPENVIEILYDAFNYCTSLPEITFPAKLKKIGDRAFQNCHLLEKINNLKSVDNIGDSAFSSCKKLDTVVLPEKITADNLGFSVFNGCDALKNVTLPYKLVEKLYTKFKFKFIFQSCNNIETVTFSDGDKKGEKLVVSFTQTQEPILDLWNESQETQEKKRGFFGKKKQKEKVDKVTIDRAITFENVSKEALTPEILKMFNEKKINKEQTTK